MTTHGVCDCVPEQKICLFCWYPAMDDYTLNQSLPPFVCSWCHGVERRGSHAHMRCIAAIQQYFPDFEAHGYNAYDELVQSLLSSRPLARLHPDPVAFLTTNFPRLFTSVILEQFFELGPELLREIFSHLDPFPELIAITNAALVTNTYENRLGPHWTSLELIKPGLSLYMTFRRFDGCAYLSNLATKPSRRWTKMVKVQNEFIVCRDRFGILNILSTDEPRPGSCNKERQTFYHRIRLDDDGTEGIRLRAFSDVSANGVFLRSLVKVTSRAPPTRMVECNELLLPHLERLDCLQIWKHKEQFFSRYEYHDFEAILGVFGVVRNGRTISLFCHRERSERDFELFATRLESSYPETPLLFLYFPFEKEEKVKALGVRWIPDSTFLTNGLIIQLATNKQRSYSFGPQPQNESLFEYHTVQPILDGFIQGFCHTPIDNNRFAFGDMGVAISTACEQVPGFNICPGDSLPCPSLGSPDRDWCFSKAHIGHNTMLHFCKANEADESCLGMLVTNHNGSRQSLGQFRLDKYLSEAVNVEDCWFRNHQDDDKLLVLVRSPPKCQNDRSSERWDQFPIMGQVVWWCGPNGNQIGIPPP